MIQRKQRDNKDYCDNPTTSHPVNLFSPCHPVIYSWLDFFIIHLVKYWLLFCQLYKTVIDWILLLPHCTVESGKNETWVKAKLGAYSIGARCRSAHHCHIGPWAFGGEDPITLEHTASATFGLPLFTFPRFPFINQLKREHEQQDTLCWLARPANLQLSILTTRP